MKNKQTPALAYHAEGRAGKIEVVPTKACQTARDLSLAYTPGVAEPCTEIHKDPDQVYNYTAKGNLVAVITNGTAVLGLGDIGPMASKPVMEGKGVLFKRFADIDVFDIELQADSADEMVAAITAMAPTFGGINLEDIRSPECFEVERRLRETLDIPVFHDDQHGTAIITGAALINAVELADKKLEELTMVVSGAGAAAIACTEFIVSLGVRKENIVLCDSKGVIRSDRDNLPPAKAEWATDRDLSSLEDAMKGVDFFLGLSVKGLVSQQMIRSMADRPIVFALANPDPEIPYAEARSVREDAIIATGRSDHPNQVNNVLGFPFIFRGALDTRARTVSEPMKLAAAHALAELAHEDIPPSVADAYGEENITYGPDYIIPKPFDPRVLFWVAPAVAQAAVDSGVARVEAFDRVAYTEQLKTRVSPTHAVLSSEFARARSICPRMIFSEGEEGRMIKAAVYARDEGICRPILLGHERTIRDWAADYRLDLEGIDIVTPWSDPRASDFADQWFRERCRSGTTATGAEAVSRRRRGFAMQALRYGETDAVICGVSDSYANYIRPALQIIGPREGVGRVAGMYMLVYRDSVKFICDATVNFDPDAEALAEIAILAADQVADFDITPRVAMVSYANFGAVNRPETRKMRAAVELVNDRRPDLIIEGEMQVDAALDREAQENFFPFSRLDGEANVLVMPNLASANISYKLLQRLSDAEVVGPILLGLAKPLTIMQRGATVSEIVNMAAVTAVQCRRRHRTTVPSWA